MKCPYCGHESENQTCDRCKAVIPVEKPEENKDEPTKVYKKKTRSE